MPTIDHNTGVTHRGRDASLGIEASSGTPSRKDFETMARRRFQDPKPRREGNYWYLRVWRDVFVGGARTRRRQRIKIAPASTLEREAKKIAAEMLRPVNQGLVTVGSAVNFTEYVDATYIPTVLPLLAKATQESSRVRIRKYLKPTFGTSCLQYDFLVKNPLDGLRLPPDKRGRRSKPFISPEQFDTLLQFVAEPYATMLYTAVWTGLRVSELIGLKWRCIHLDSISIDQR
jgi:integrase